MPAERIDKEQVLFLIARPTTTLIDLSGQGPDRKIQGAIEEVPDKPDEWMHKYSPDDILVIYCN